jgi:hypothetical protein
MHLSAYFFLNYSPTLLVQTAMGLEATALSHQ